MVAMSVLRRSHESPPQPQSFATTMPQRLTSREDYATFVDNFDTFLFDCDGVLWHGDDLVPGAVEVLSLLRARRESPRPDRTARRGR